MSVREGLRTRETTGRGIENTSTPIESRLARLKGRLSGSQSLHGGDATGLSDPFAEIFARIASTEPPPPSPPANAEPSDLPAQVDEDTREQDASEVDDSQREADAEWVNAQATPVLIESVDQEVQVESTEATALQVTQNSSQDQPNDQPNEQSTNQPTDQPKADQPQTEAEPTVINSSPQETESETEVSAARTEEQLEDVVVDAEGRRSAAQEIDHRRYNSGEAIVVDGQVETETAEPAVKLDQPNRSETTDDAPDQQKSSYQEQAPASQSDERVQRRRYSDERGANHDPVAQNSESSISRSNDRAPIGNRSTIASANAATSTNNSIDVSAMTPTATASPLAAGAAAAVAKHVSTSASSSSLGVKGNSVTSTGGTSPGVTSAGVTSSAATDRSGPGLDTSATNQRGDATSRTSPHGGATGTDTLSAVQRAKLVQRVSRGFQHLGPNGGQIRMRLSPEALGSVQLQLNIRNGELSGTMIAQTDAASAALREQLPQLRRSLEIQGIRMDSIEIETESASNTMDAQTSDQRFGDSSGHSRQPPFGQSATPGQTPKSHWSQVRPTPQAERTVAPMATWSPTSSGVDLRV